MKQSRKNRIPALGVCFAAGLLFAFGPVRSGSAQTESSEFDLLGVLVQDLRVETDPNQTAAMDPPPVVQPEDIVVERAAGAIVPDRNNDLLLANSPTTAVQRQLWKERIGGFGEAQSRTSRNELEDLMQQLRAIEIKPRVPVLAPPVETAPVAESEPNIVAAEPEPAPQPRESAAAGEGLIGATTLEQFKALSETADRLRNPLELAEILFAAGCLQEAAACYREALTRVHGQEDDPFGDKAWICLQLGNCLSVRDPQTALEYYQEVIVEFSSSPWASLAKTKSDVINWQLKDQPEMLILASKQDINYNRAEER